jgi:hypothetical protein
MGKYSIENYNQYDSYKIRPVPSNETPVNYGRGKINYLEYNWEELEPERGCFHFSHMIETIDKTFNPVLVIYPKRPVWQKDFGEECFASFLRKVGSSLTEHTLIGVLITTINDSLQEWEAYVDAFETITIFADLHNSALIHFLKDRSRPFGLYVTCSEANWMDCCEAFARLKLQDTWERMPVLLHITDPEAGENISREHLRWHAAFSNRNMDIGYNFTLRRLTYPKRISSCGALPLRFWFVNTGSAPCYNDFSLRVLLRNANSLHVFSLLIDKKAWKTGDIIHNEIVGLPELEPGSYTLLAGIFLQGQVPINLDIQGNAFQGFYELGNIDVGTKAEIDLLHAWDNFYPDGYYPLEDPKTPNE